MTAQGQPNKLNAILPYIFSVVAYFAGSYINSLNYTSKVDGLITAVESLNSKFDAKTKNDNEIDKRVSRIEFYLFEYKKPTNIEKP